MDVIELAKNLNHIVETPKGNMRLVEIYFNGNVGCIPLNCKDYYKGIKEFHWESIKLIK
jgi:hypothetical protein